MDKKVIFAILGAAVLIAVIVLRVRVVGGAVTILSGGLNTVLGVVVRVALVVIVVWMCLFENK